VGQSLRGSVASVALALSATFRVASSISRTRRKMMKNEPHKWAEVIKAWADGREIQWRSPQHSEHWSVFTGIMPKFQSNTLEFRISPEVVEQFYIFCPYSMRRTWHSDPDSNLKLTFTDGKLTASEVLK
jgi:hypothetical protein